MLNLPSRYDALSEEVRAVLGLSIKAELAVNDLMGRASDRSRAPSDARVELSERIRHMRHCIYKVATCRFMTGAIPEPYEDQNVELMDHQEVRFYMEGFYNVAWRAHRVIFFLSGTKIPFDGVNMVRNKLIEHCQDQDLEDNPLFINSVGGIAEGGPRLKNVRMIGDTTSADKYHDAGIYSNASEFFTYVIDQVAKLN